MLSKQFLMTLALSIAAIGSQAQLIEIPMTDNPSLQAAARQNSSLQRTQSTVPLTLPYVEDFSYSGNYPTPMLWKDSSNATVSRGMGQNVPTIGAVTLDGLKRNGTPYYEANNVRGWCDTLTSLPFDLSTYSAASSIYFSFFYQRGGYGFAPSTNDSLVLQFRKSDGSWQKVSQLVGNGGSVPDVNFTQISVPVTDPAYLYNGFMFRFYNYGSRQGMQDIWNIDYLKMAANRFANEPHFNDVAFADMPPSFLKPYTAMPLSHFKANKEALTNTNMTFTVRNNFNVSKSPQLGLRIDELTQNTTVFPTETPIFPVINSATTTTTTALINYGTIDFNALNTQDTGIVRTSFFFNNITGQDQFTNQPNFPLSNDTISRLTALTNYFAYDDGTPEVRLRAENIGTQAAVEFQTVIADTLRGMRVHIPHVEGNVSQAFINLRVYIGTLDSSPEFTRDFARPIYVDSLNGWTTYAFDPPLLLPANTKFYVGWQTQSTTPTPIGFDKNSPNGTQYIHQNVNGVWSNVPNISGALMLRAVVGSRPIINTVATASMLMNNQWSVYPNPSNGNVQITLPQDGTLWQLTLTNTLGQNLREVQTSTVAELTNLEAGTYFIQVRNAKTQLLQGTKKIVVIK